MVLKKNANSTFTPDNMYHHYKKKIILRQSVAELGYGMETGELRHQGWLRALSVSILWPRAFSVSIQSPLILCENSNSRKEGTWVYKFFTFTFTFIFTLTFSIIFNLLDLFFNYQHSSTFNLQPSTLQPSTCIQPTSSIFG